MAVVKPEIKTTEYEMFSRYRETGDIALRDEIVSSYIYIAEILSRKFINRGVEYDDIFQVACMGILYAVERFDPGKGVEFATYATPTVTAKSASTSEIKATLSVSQDVLMKSSLEAAKDQSVFQAKYAQRRRCSKNAQRSRKSCLRMFHEVGDIIVHQVNLNTRRYPQDGEFEFLKPYRH